MRVVFTEHGRLSDAPPSAKRRLANTVFRRFSREVFAVSEDVKAHLVGEGFGARQVGVIYNGIDVGPLPTAGLRAEIRRRLGVGDAEFVIGTIARLNPVKDLGTLLRATATLAQSISATLVVVGDGSERHALEAWHWNWASRRASGFLVSGTMRATGWRGAMPTSTRRSARACR